MSLDIDVTSDIAVVTVDYPPVNALSHDLRRRLLEAVTELDADPAIRAVVLICAGRTFIAGADLTEFDKPPQEPHLPDVVNAIEAARKPWIAAIHGAALGGGFEVALGCRFRVASSAAKVGLPEVTLGIIPGAGGTVRTPRLADVETAAALITSGKAVAAAEALSVGLVDRIIDGDLLEGAVAFVREALDRPLPLPVARRQVRRPREGFWEEAERRTAKEARGSVAPLRALASLRKTSEAPLAEAMAFERETFLELRASEQAGALRRVFLAERAALRPARLQGIEARRLATVAVIGGGTMGAGIAVALREAGVKVTLLEQDHSSVARGLANVAKIINAAVARGRIDAAEAGSLETGVIGTSDYTLLAAVDVAIEAVFEDMDVKRKVFAKLARYCRPDAILGTNTSYLDPREIAEGLTNPERFLGLHFFSPANVMKLLEIVPIPATSPSTISTGFALARLLGKIPVQAGICEGFIGNRILLRYRALAELLVREGVAIADVDAAMRGYGFAMGPFEAQDLAGLDIAHMQRESARAAGRAVPSMLGDILVLAGRKGRKTSGGWYDYDADQREPRPSAEVARLLEPYAAAANSMPKAAIAERLVAGMASEGQAILDEGIADSPSDIDLVEIHGYGFPRWRGGPMYATRRKDHQ